MSLDFSFGNNYGLFKTDVIVCFQIKKYLNLPNVRIEFLDFFAKSWNIIYKFSFFKKNNVKTYKLRPKILSK